MALSSMCSSIEPAKPSRNGGMDLVPDCALKIVENEDSYIVHAELPRLNKESIHVQVDGNRVTLGIERKISSLFAVQSRRNDVDFQIIHKFVFDCTIEAAKAQATYRNGELILILPKITRSGKRLLIN